MITLVVVRDNLKEASGLTQSSNEETYGIVENWAKLPSTIRLGEVVDIDVDAHDNVYVFNRGRNPVLVFKSDGTFLNSWGELYYLYTGKHVFRREGPHGITITPNNYAYCADHEAHVVLKFTLEGTLLMTLGNRDKPSVTGFTGFKFEGTTVKQGADPFNLPTQAVESSSGEIFVSDGYGNTRVHKFSNNGEFLLSWGEPGTGINEFYLPHSLCLDKDNNVYVTDRESSRIQIFSENGEYITEWTDIARPSDMVIGNDGCFYIVSGEYVTQKALDGEILAQWPHGGHGIAIDSKRDIYLGELQRRIIKLAKS